MAAIHTPKELGSYLWDKTAWIGKETASGLGRAALEEAPKAWADIGNTFQAVLYGGWSPQAAHNATMHMVQEQAIEEDNKRIEPQQEITHDGPEK